jgi:hypothetical protein
LQGSPSRTCIGVANNMGLKTPAKQKEASGPDVVDRSILFGLRKESEAEQEERLVPKFSQTFSTVLSGKPVEDINAVHP